jgi:hypothetical protein
MINEVDFNLLGLDHKAHLVFQKQNFLTSRTIEGFEISLYSLGSLLIEVWYSYTKNKIEQIKTSNYSDLDLYLKEICLNALVE